MRLTFFVVWKSWASNPLRTALSVLGVALGIAIVTAIHVMDHNTIESQMRLKRPDFGRMDLELVSLDPTRPPEVVRAQLEAMPDVAAVGVLQQGVMSLTIGGKSWGEAPVYGLSPLPSISFAHYHVAEGEDLSDLDGDAGVLVGRTLAELAGLRPGMRIEVSRPRVPARALCRKGVRVVVEDGDTYEPGTTEVVVKGVLANKRLGARDAGVMMISSFALARRLAPTQGPVFQINRSPGVDIDRLRQELAEDFEVQDQRSSLLGERSDERAFRNGVKVLGCLALVMGMFVIFQTLSQSLVERLKQIGLLRALGTSRRVIAGVFLVDATATAIVGAVLGVGGGIALAAALQQMGISTLGRGKQIVIFEVPFEPVMWTALIGIVFTLAGAGFPLWKARNLPALEALSARGVGAGQKGGEAYVLRGVNLFLFTMLVLVLPVAYLAMTPILSEEKGEMRIVLLQLGAMILLFGSLMLVAPRLVQVLGGCVLVPVRRKLPLPVFLVRRFLDQSPGRFAASVCGLSVVLMALLACKSITYALRAEVWNFGEVAMHGRLFLRTEPMDPATAQQLLDVPGVRGGELFDGQANPRFPLRGLAATDLQGEGGVLEHRPNLARIYQEHRSLILSRRLAHLRDKRAGDVMLVLTDDGPVSYTVLAVSDDTGFFPDERAWALAAPRWLRADFCTGRESVEQASLELEPGASGNAVLASVRERIPKKVPWAKTGWELSDYQIRDVTLDFALFDVLLALILALAGVGLVNTMSIAALSRSREIGVLRALGMDKRTLRQTFLLEGAVMAVLSALIALALAAPLGIVVVAGLNRVAGLEAPFVMPWLWALIVPALAAGTGVLAAILPGMRAVSESPAEAVRYE